MNTFALRVTGLTKVFDGTFSFETFKRTRPVIAVDDVSFVVATGEIVGLLGPNGAGKTTIIQMLLGATTKSRGNIEYFGQDMDKHRSEVLEWVSYASAYTRLPWQLTVFENLMVYARMYNVPDPSKRIHKLLAEFKMEKFAKKRMGSLSAGQTTRVILAKAFINYPKLILLDEPTASLDPESAQTVRQFLIRQQKKYKVAMLFTSHNMTEVAEV
jgi:ABC-2 type transport system ATP-binding protein